MDKPGLLAVLINYFKQEYHVLERAAMHAYETATDSENIKENKYGTRSLMASYLAQSQSKRAMELKKTIGLFQGLPPTQYTDDDLIKMGALITVEDDQGEIIYFLGPDGGGARVTYQDQQVTVVTPGSPLGRALLGKGVGDEVSIGRNFDVRNLEIIAVR